MDINRRDFFKMAGTTAVAAMAATATSAAVTGVDRVVEAASKNITLAGQAPVVGSKLVKSPVTGSTAKVYFTKKIDAANLIKLYDLINNEIFGKVAIKVHTGEPNGPNIIPREIVKAFQNHVPNSTIVETNTLYKGKRYTTEDHRETLKINGWNFSTVDILDENEETVDFPVNNGLHLKYVTMGGHLANYDSLIVLTHFKGHGMGGFGGSMKNIAIGCASGHVGKRQVHGVVDSIPDDFKQWPMEDYFMELMADSAKATCDHFGKKIVFLNVMRRMSVDCDCAGTRAAEPTLADIGICASTDILAVDQACCDLVYNASDSHDLKERIESRHGLRQLSAMAELKMGNPQYELLSVD